MPIADVQCLSCSHKQELNYTGAASEAAKKVRCPECGGALKVDWSTLATGKPIMKFVAGKYNIGTSDLGGKYYSTQREMINDAARNGIKVERT